MTTSIKVDPNTVCSACGSTFCLQTGWPTCRHTKEKREAVPKPGTEPKAKEQPKEPAKAQKPAEPKVGKADGKAKAKPKPSSEKGKGKGPKPSNKGQDGQGPSN